MPTESLLHKGARTERYAILRYLRKHAKISRNSGNLCQSYKAEAFKEVIDFILSRDDRYKKRKGGL